MSNPYLLLIETSTEVCSVALSAGDSIISYRVIKEAKSHARVIAPIINEVLAEGGLTINPCKGYSSYY